MVSDWLLSLCPPDPTPLHPGTPSGGLDSREQGVQGTRNLSVKKVCPLKVGNGFKRNHPYGRNQRRTKEPLDESERGERKGWWKEWFQFHQDQTGEPTTLTEL